MHKNSARVGTLPLSSVKIDMAYLNHNLPTFTCFIRNEYLYNHEKGHGEYTLCDVHSVASIEKRVPLFDAFLENGVQWARRPISAFCWKKNAPVLPLEYHCYWDSFSPYVDVQIKQRLAGLKAELIGPDGKKNWGEYMFTLDWGWENKAAILDVNFSETPEHKTANCFKMDDGNFFLYPNNRIIWADKAWTFDRISKNTGYKIDMTVYSVENKEYKETDYNYMTKFKSENEEFHEKEF